MKPCDMPAFLSSLTFLTLEILVGPRAVAQREKLPAPPFEAEVTVAMANVRSGPSHEATILGTVQRGARLAVVDCLPNCNAEGGWAVLSEGAIPLSLLTQVGLHERIPPPIEQHYVYGSVRRSGARVYEAPDPRAKVVKHVSPGFVIALMIDNALANTSWMRRLKGGFVRRTDLRLLSPSRLQGEKVPHLPLGFAWRATVVSDSSAASDLTRPLPKYSHLPVVEELRTKVRVEGGFLPKNAMRIAHRQARPPEIPEGAKWVHVDPSQQTLVAYEGDHPVFATLVSTGVAGKRTHMGLHRLWLKTVHDLMHGVDYYVEEVPYTLYFARGQALHGAFWHDRFGRAVTHGCVNLSMADAEWLFVWAPPPLPESWHSITPPRGMTSLWVLVANSESALTLVAKKVPAGNSKATGINLP